MDRIKEIERRLNIMSSYKQQDLKMSERQEMYYDNVQYLLEENKRLREALKQISHANDSDLIEHPHEMASIAQQALREDDKDGL